MPLTASSPYLDSLVRRRAQQEAMRLQGQQIGAGLQSGLASADASMRDAEEKSAIRLRLARQDAAQAAQRKTENENAAIRLRLEGEQNARAATAATTAEEQRQIENERNAAKDKATATVNETAARDAFVDEQIRAAIGSGEDAESLASRLLEMQEARVGAQGLGSSQVKARYAQIFKEIEGGENAADLKNRAAEADIARTKAQTSSEYTRAQAAKDAAAAKATAAGAGTDGAFALTKPARNKVQTDRLKVQVSLNTTGRLRAMLSDPRMQGYTGPLDGLVTHLVGRVGMNDRDAAKVATALGRAIDEYRVAVTGAAASERELRMLEQRNASLTDDLSQALGKLDASEEADRAKLEHYDAILQANDIRGAGGAGGPVDDTTSTVDDDIATADAFFLGGG